MRCPKCGIITFDYLEKCWRCGMNLTASRKLLGEIIKADDSFCWFDAIYAADASGAAIKNKDIDISVRSAARLTEIDVSDLVEERHNTEADVVDIDPGVLKRAASDEEFQQALSELIGEK